MTLLRRKPVRRRSKKVDAFRADLDRLRPMLLERADYRCEIEIPKECTGAWELGLIVHHRKLRSQGGDNDPSNLLVLCDGCHRRIHDTPALSYAAGWLVHGYEDPLDVTITSYRRNRD